MFAAYFATPSVSYVARCCGVSRETVRRWRERDRWQARAAQISGAALTENLVAIDEMKAKVERVITALLHKFLERVESGDVVIETPTDMVTICRFWLTLRGEAEQIGKLELLPSGTPVEQATPIELKEAVQPMLAVTAGFERRLAIIDAEAEILEGSDNGNGNGNGGTESASE